MNFSKGKSSWSTIQLDLLKICVGSAYMMVGAYFHEFSKISYYFLPYCLSLRQFRSGSRG